MKKMIRFAVILLLLLIALIGAAVVFILSFDLNRLKPTLQAAAAEQGATLVIPGDLSWTFWPNLGLRLGELHLSNTATGSNLAAIQSANVTVQLQPLFSKKILIDGIYLSGMAANYTIDKTGKTNWQELLDKIAAADTQTEPKATEPSDSTIPTLEINTITIENLALHYSNAMDGSRFDLADTHLQCDNFAIDGRPFPLQLQTRLTYQDKPQIQLQWQSPVGVDLGRNLLTIDQGLANIKAADAEADLTISTQTVWAPELNSNGQLTIRSKNLGAFLKAFKIDAMRKADPNVLQKMELQLQYEFQQQKLRIHGVKLRLDDTKLEGDLSVENFDRPQIRSQWQGTTLDLDRYLPPAETAQVEPAPAGPPTPLPHEQLKALDLNFKIGFDEIRKNNISLSKPTLAVTAKQGLITLSQLTSGVAEGQITGQGVFDARKKNTQLDLSLATQGVDVGKLLAAFADIKQIAGKVSADIQITSKGETDQALIDNLQAHAQAQSDGLKLIPFNLEEQFCNAIAILQKSTPQTYEWPKQTLLEPVRIQLGFAQNTLNLDSLSAEIASLLGTAKGEFNVATGKFNIPFALSLGEFANNLPGCLPIEEKWRKRALPIRCKGSLDAIGVKTCLPDTELLSNLLKEKAKAQLEKEKDKVEDKLKDKSKELLNKELGEEKSKKAEENVRDLLKQIKGK